jgi:hypothetical protein
MRGPLHVCGVLPLDQEAYFVLIKKSSLTTHIQLSNLCGKEKTKWVKQRTVLHNKQLKAQNFKWCRTPTPTHFPFTLPTLKYSMPAKKEMIELVSARVELAFLTFLCKTQLLGLHEAPELTGTAVTLRTWTVNVFPLD